ncbi:hypothetical protein NED98_13305 [Sphingomonas sp. MMSM20]|uniref:hypothetical protein n=1 Tax=Sphingomonas lycopersici TaxID=2951807 RepID=UPI002238C79E|nr:hypothetical protein [Sphingomonas lycopersici]MCW6531223.1 hypothetical protein [Sphingomonas lycopersici]
MALVAMLAGVSSLKQSLAYSERGIMPELAHQLAPGDGRITALLSEKLSNPEATATDRAEADRLASLALRQDPTAVPALATLGIDAQIRGETARARRIFAYAQLLSRRDLRTQLWAIEDAVARGDVADALRQYDITLRTSEYGPDLLFPVLASAIADPAIREALMRTLATKPAWTASFIEYAAVNSPDPRTTFSLLSGLRRIGVAVPSNAKVALVNALLRGDFYDEAWTYYASLRPGANRRRSRDSRFTAQFDSPSPLDWNVIGDAGISASIQRGDKGGVFDFSAPPSVGGAVLRQMQLLPPGDYLLEGHSSNIEQPSDARPYWQLTCVDGRELGRVEIANSAQTGAYFAGRIRVPTGCVTQYLVLVVRPSDLIAGSSGQIDRVQLAPAQ